MSDDTDKIKVSNSSANTAGVIMSGLAWQEDLLQSYRSQATIGQSLFLAVAALLLNAQTAANHGFLVVAFFMVISGLALYSIVILRRLRATISSRALAVDWWQDQMIDYEDQHSQRRIFVEFRISRKSNHKDLPSQNVSSLSTEELNKLKHKNKGASDKISRSAIDFQFNAFLVLWVVFILLSFFDVGTTLLNASA